MGGARETRGRQSLADNTSRMAGGMAPASVRPARPSQVCAGETYRVGEAADVSETDHRGSQHDQRAVRYGRPAEESAGTTGVRGAAGPGVSIGANRLHLHVLRHRSPNL